MKINTYDQLKAAVSSGLIPKAVAVTYYRRPSGRMGMAQWAEEAGTGESELPFTSGHSRCGDLTYELPR